ncbi:hypothetical protein QBC42DRAFT_280374 [Cladorrhinum samala]|uniref:Uncharacterized protein n=1 Tax=Cladorrhinum samala TaxID=585594 RepID=A0AAV9H8J3_9PEZI|nr:hypothetical protein QBC42DRAFT_280374 [Cladorrhinum samala]
MSKSTSSSAKTYTWVTVWYCDNCRDGPHTKLIVDYCPLCGHRRCPYCPRDEIKRYDNR